MPLRTQTILVALAVIVTMQEVESTRLLAQTSDFSTLYGHFRRTFKSPSSADTTEGEFYYCGPGKMHITVSYPLKQIMVIEANVTTIYYPAERRVFRLESENPVALPLVPGLMAAIRPDFGLADMGLSLLKQEMRQDTAISVWSHPKARRRIGEFKVAEVKDRLVYTSYVSPDSLNRNRTDFSNHVSVSGIFFPTKIASAIRGPKEKATELVLLSGLKINIEIPGPVANFKIPEDVPVTKRKW